MFLRLFNFFEYEIILKTNVVIVCAHELCKFLFYDGFPTPFIIFCILKNEYKTVSDKWKND